MEIIFQLKDLVFLGVLLIGVWFSYRVGYKSGLSEGIDETLAMIEERGFIKIIELDDGEVHIIGNER